MHKSCTSIFLHCFLVLWRKDNEKNSLIAVTLDFFHIVIVYFFNSLYLIKTICHVISIKYMFNIGRKLTINNRYEGV